MSKAAYWQRGESLDYTNATTQIIEANTIIPIGERIGIAGTVINPGEVGSIHVTGVYEMPKTGTSEIGMGMAVYFDGEGITETANNGKSGDEKVSYPAAGYAVKAAKADDAVILVKLPG